MQRHAVAIVLASSFLGLAACASRTAPPAVSNRAASADPVEAPLAGSYTTRHTITMVCDSPDPCEEEVTDRLSIEPVDGGDLAVTIDVVRDNGHSCSFADRLERDPADPARWRFHTDDDAEGGACDLTLVRYPDRVELAAEGCRYYCGARAYLDGIFPVPGA